MATPLTWSKLPSGDYRLSRGLPGEPLGPFAPLAHVHWVGGPDSGQWLWRALGVESSERFTSPEDAQAAALGWVTAELDRASKDTRAAWLVAREALAARAQADSDDKVSVAAARPRRSRKPADGQGGLWGDGDGPGGTYRVA